jgi:hypothetical protein
VVINNQGMKKKQFEFAASLANRMSTETNTKWDSKNVINKIQHIEKKWREAHNFATSETGAGIKEVDGEVSFDDIVQKKCPYYFELLDVMSDRASSAPKLTCYADDDEDSINDSLSSDENEDTTSAVASATSSSICWILLMTFLESRLVLVSVDILFAKLAANCFFFIPSLCLPQNFE